MSQKNKPSAEALQNAISACLSGIDVLREARVAMYVHPRSLRDPWTIESAVFRTSCILLIDAFELVFEVWNDQPFVAYAKASKNSERYRALVEGFQAQGVNLSKDTIEDFLAFKYIRNTVTHGGKNDDEVKHIKSRGFPERILTHSHPVYGAVERLFSVSHSLLDAVVKATESRVSLQDVRLHLMGDIAVALKPRAELSAVIRTADIPTVRWNNIEYTYQTMQFSSNASSPEMKTQAVDIFLENSRELSAQMREAEDCDKSTFFLFDCVSSGIRWGLPLGTEIDMLIRPQESAQLSDLLAPIRRAASGVQIPEGSKIWDASIPDEVVSAFLSVAFKSSIDRLDIHAMRMALRDGSWAYRQFRSPSLVRLGVLLCKTQSSPSQDLLRETNKIRSSFVLGRAWYDYLEDPKRLLETMANLRNEFHVEAIPDLPPSPV